MSSSLAMYAAISRAAEALLDAQAEVRYYSGCAAHPEVRGEAPDMSTLLEREHSAEGQLRRLVIDSGLGAHGVLPPLRTAEGRLLLVRPLYFGAHVQRVVVEQLSEVIDLAEATRDARPLGPGERRGGRHWPRLVGGEWQGRVSG